MQMLRYAAGESGARFGLIVHHIDAERDRAYDRKSSVGKLDKALDVVPPAGWTVANMKNDWKTIFTLEASAVRRAVEAPRLRSSQSAPSIRIFIERRGAGDEFLDRIHRIVHGTVTDTVDRQLPIVVEQLYPHSVHRGYA